MYALSTLGAVEFFAWIFVLVLAISFVAWISKKNAALGVLLGVGLAYAIFQVVDIPVANILGFFN